ncbi:glutamate synthase subunit alpha [Sesbania bispinosa]|nr:glutamate synthase subunit alpha [Sesbania bispinosa]
MKSSTRAIAASSTFNTTWKSSSNSTVRKGGCKGEIGGVRLEERERDTAAVHGEDG